MEAFLPSEIGRLIYGYLFQQCGEGLADEFLNSCDSMRECCLLKQKYAKNFHHKVQDLSLEDILNQYSVLCSLIFKQAASEEPVHRNVLGLLKKLLSSRLLGLSGSSADCSRVAKPTGNKIDGSVCDKTEASKTVFSIAQSKQPVNLVDKVNNSEGDRTGVVETAVSVVQSELSANPTDGNNVAFSPGVSDAGDNCLMDVDDDFSCEDTSGKETSLNVAKESAPVVSSMAKESAPVVPSTECRQKIVSPNAESRICAVLCNSASMEERGRQLAGMSNPPFLVEYSTPRKQQVKSTFSVSTLSSTASTKTTISMATTVVGATKVMKSIENVSKNLSSAAESGLVTPKSGEHSSGKLADQGAKKEKVLQRDSNRKPSKTITTASTSTLESTTKVTDQLMVTSPSTGAVEVSPTTVSTNLPSVPTATVSFVYQEPRVSTTASSVTNAQRVPALTSTGAVIPEESTESVFGELAFESESSLPGRLDRSNSSMKSDSEVVNKLRQSPIKRSPAKASASPVDSLLSPRSRVIVSPIQNSATRTSETTLQTPVTSASDAVVLPNSDKTAPTGSQKKDTPWDLNLRSFFDNAAPMDAHITKRKPKDLRDKKLKEISKKRKHNDINDALSTAKRFKSETVAAVSVSVATPRQPPLIFKSVDADRTIGGVPPQGRRHRATKDVPESTLGLEKKSVRNSRSKSAQENKITETVNLVKMGEESARTPEAATSVRSSTSENDIFNVGSPVAGKKKSECPEKATAVERKQQTANVKKVNQEVAKTRSSTKPVSPGDKTAIGGKKAANSTGTAKDRKKKEQIEDRMAAKKKSEEAVDPKIAPLKKSSLQQVQEKPSSSPRKMSKSHRKDAQSKVTDDVTKDTDEILENHNRSSSVAIVETTHNPIHIDEELFMVLEITPEFELFCRSPRYKDS